MCRWLQYRRRSGLREMFGRLKDIHSGRPLPDGDGPDVRRESGDKRAVEAWKVAGEIWSAINSCIVIQDCVHWTEEGKIASIGQRAGGSRESRNG